MPRRHWRHAEPLSPAISRTAAVIFPTGQYPLAMRLTGLASATLLAAVSFAFAPQAHAQPSFATTANASNTTAARDYNLPAGPLDATLSRFAAEAGVLLSANASLTRGKTAPALKGRYTVDGAFSTLLGPSGLQAVRDASGVFLLRVAPVPIFGAQEIREQQMSAVIVSGKRNAREEIYQTPDAVSVVTREDIDRLPPRSISDVLDSSAGVFAIQESRSDPGYAVNIRGLQDFGRVNMMLDGTRQNFQKSGHGVNGQIYLAPELLASVDITKGPSSTVGGAGTLAGTINFRTLDYEDLVKPGNNRGGRLSATLGNNGFEYSGTAAYAQRLDNVDLMVAGSTKQVDEFEPGRRRRSTAAYQPIDANPSQKSGLFKATWHIADDQWLKLGYTGFRSDYGTSTTQGLSDAADVDTVSLSHRWQPLGGDWIDLSSQLYYTKTKVSTFEPNESLTHYGDFDFQYATSTIGGSVSNISRFDLAGLDAKLQFGGEFYRDETDPSAEQLTVGSGNGDWWTGATPDGQRTVTSLFSEFTLAHPRSGLQAIAGLRYDYFQLKGNGRIHVDTVCNLPEQCQDIFSRFSVNRHQGKLAPKLTLAWQANEPLQLFTSFGIGMRPPHITESLIWGRHPGGTFPFIPNPALRPEISRIWELGANLVFDQVLTKRDKLRAKAVLFHNNVKDYVITAPVLRPTDTAQGALSSSPMAYVNLDGTMRIRGLELELDYDAEWWFTRLAYTRTLMHMKATGYDPFPMGSMVGYPSTSYGRLNYVDAFNMVPGKKAVLTSGVRLFDRKLEFGWRLRREEADVNLVGGALTPRWARWTTHDIWASYAFTGGVTARLAINNLRDHYYLVRSGSSVTYASAPGRTVLGTLSWIF